MLASDLNNPEFLGAKDPNTNLSVEFYHHEPVDAWSSMKKSIELQRRVDVKLPKSIYVRIMTPGDPSKSEVVQEVQEHHKRRFPNQWLAWQISEGIIDAAGADVPGWKLSEWPDINDEERRELAYLRFQTVDQVAGASDKQIQGMGMGGLAMRAKAKEAMRNRMGAEVKAEIEKRDAEAAMLREQVAAQAEQMTKLQEQFATMMAREMGRVPGGKLGLPKAGPQPEFEPNKI